MDGRYCWKTMSCRTDKIELSHTGNILLGLIIHSEPKDNSAQYATRFNPTGGQEMDRDDRVCTVSTLCIQLSNPLHVCYSNARVLRIQPLQPCRCFCYYCYPSASNPAANQWRCGSDCPWSSRAKKIDSACGVKIRIEGRNYNNGGIRWH